MSQITSHPTQGYLSAPLEFEGERWNGLYRSIGLAVALFVLVLIGIAAIAPLHEVAVANGAITPTQQPSTLQHDQGGVVEILHFRSGDEVQAGQVIVQLRAFQNEREQAQLHIRRANIAAEVLKFEALIAGKEPDFTSVFPEISDADLSEQQRQAYEEEQAVAAQSEALYQARLEQRQAERNAAEAELTSLADERRAYQALVEMRAGLVAEGYATRRSLLEAEADLARVEGEMARLAGRIESATNAISEARAELAHRQSELRARWSLELARKVAERKELDQQVIAERDRFDRLAIRAPFDGRLQDLLPKAPGEVVGAGEVIGQIVPLDSTLFALVRLPPKDVGMVSVDDQAILSVTAFDPDLFGDVFGTVSKISPTTNADADGQAFYAVDIQLDPEAIAPETDLTQLRAGMELEARIVTQERTLLRYFLRPVYRALERAFSEN